MVNLALSSYSLEVGNIMKNLLSSEDLSDVTIVCDDRVRLKAHKFVLKAYSSFFNDIFGKDEGKESIIYLKGVPCEAMKSLLKFMYHGQTQFFQDKLEDFLRVGRELEVKEISRFNADNKEVQEEVTEIEQKEEINDESPVEELFDVSKFIDDVDTDFGEIVEQNPSTFEDYDNKPTQNEIRRKLNIFDCTKCDKKFSTITSLHDHFYTVHGTTTLKFKCGICGIVCSTREEIQNHTNKEHTEPLLQEPQQIEKFSEQERQMPKLNMEIPIVSVQNSTQRSYVPLKQSPSPLYCSPCQYQTFTRKDFIIHMQSKEHLSAGNMAKSAKYFCPDCGKEFTSEEQQQEHTRIVHATKTKTFSCIQCGFKTTQKTILKLHIKASHEATVCYPCDQCDFKATERSVIKDHIETNHEPVGFPCSFADCNFKAKKESVLQIHIQSNHEELKFSCDKKGCSYETFHKISYNHHLQTVHSAQKCLQCEFTAKTKSELKTHIYSNHIKYPCTECDFESTNRDELSSHMKNEHLF